MHPQFPLSMKSLIAIAALAALANPLHAQSIDELNGFVDTLPSCFKTCASSSLSVSFPLQASDIQNLCTQGQNSVSSILGCLQSQCSSEEFGTVATKAGELSKFCAAPQTTEAEVPTAPPPPPVEPTPSPSPEPDTTAEPSPSSNEPEASTPSSPSPSATSSAAAEATDVIVTATSPSLAAAASASATSATTKGSFLVSGAAVRLPSAFELVAALAPFIYAAIAF
ncbi:hypothetical protein HDU96_005106 [Phlyctochytrium bullatum]|nr:hypothetical protein HDU96_005106 [Phlyctochytrium bullatum]